MLLYGENYQNSKFYCDNNLKFTELFPVSVDIGSFAGGTSKHFWTRYPYGVFFVKSGSLRVSGEKMSINLGDDSFFIHEPYQSFDIYAFSECEYIGLQFSGTRAADFQPFSGQVHSNDGIYDELVSIIEREDRHDVFLVSVLYKLYGTLGIQNNTAPDEKNINPYVKMIMDNIDNSYASIGYSLENVSRDLGLNPKYVSRLFKSETGITMQEYLKRRRLESAYKLLMRGYKVKYASTHCGIADASNFSEMFKNYYGIRPSEVYKTRSR